MVFQVDEGRGCPNNCHFCIHPRISGRKFRLHSAQKIIDQIKFLQQKFGAVSFRFTGSNTSKQFLNEFSELVLKENLNIHYSCYASINTTSEDIIGRLKASGLAGVFIGVETLDKEILLKKFNKHGQTREKAHSLISAFLKNGIYVTTSWIYPMPGETPQTREEVKSFILEAYRGTTHDDGSVMVLPACVVPNTEWYDNPEKYGFSVPDKEAYTKHLFHVVPKLFLPRALLGIAECSVDNRPYEEILTRADKLIKELEEEGIPTGVSDDWFLQGKLSGQPMNRFIEEMLISFATGDYTGCRKNVEAINENSRQMATPPLLNESASHC